ncbi:vascular cell adhesion protein 1 [Pelodytes ibericus]
MVMDSDSQELTDYSEYIENVSLSYSWIPTEEHEGTEKTSDIHNYISSASSIIISPPESVILAQIGDPLVITSTATDCDEPSITWSSLMDKTLTGTVNTHGHSSNLTMTAVTIESEGQYRCKVFCKNGTSEKSFKIISHSFPSDPILHVSSFVVGVQSTITCTVPRVYPTERMTIKILVDNEMVMDSDSQELTDYSEYIENVSLSYSWIPTEEHEGTELVCVAQLEFDEIEPKTRDTKIVLNLNYPPGDPYITVHPSPMVKWMETISLNCMSKSRSPVKVWWVKLAGDQQLDIESDRSGNLTIDNAELEHSGVYTCYVENVAGRKSASVEITVQSIPDAPTLNILPATPVYVGNTVNIECYGNGESWTNFTLWLVSTTGLKLLLDKEGVFEINEAQPQDGALYLCRAENPFGKADTMKSLIVEYSPQNTMISYNPSVVNVGDSVTLSCISDAVPSPNFFIYQLTKPGDSVHAVAGPYMTIENITSMNNGLYECEASNLVGSQRASVELVVRSPPKNTQLIVMPSVSVREGEPVRILCLSTAFPTPELVLKQKTELGMEELDMRNGEYTILHAALEHAGAYVCESRNVAGHEITETILSVQVPPQNTMVVVIPSENVTEGDTVTITCQTSSIPSPTILLEKVCLGNSTVLEAKNGSFTLRNVSLNDTGTYKVSIINGVGKRTEVIEINVQERQQSPKQSFTVPIVALTGVVVSTVVIGSIIYHLKQSRVQGSYSLVEALKSKV